MTHLPANVVIAAVPGFDDSEQALAVSAILCVDSAGLDGLGRILGHMAVGLVDQAVHVRLMSSDPRIQDIALGPIRSLIHGAISWPLAHRRIREAVDAAADPPPTICHAVSAGSYRVAIALAEAFDADLVLQVTSVADCDGVARLSGQRVARFLAYSPALVGILEDQLGLASERIELIRPGLLASKNAACFADHDREATVLCTAPFEKQSGVARLIEATGVLRRRGQHVLVFLLGRGSREAYLRSMIRRLDLSGQIMIAQPLGDSEEAMKSADIFVRPSVETAFDLDALQAMAAGMVVVTMANPICDYLRGNETAIVCEKQSAESLADCLSRVLSDRGAARKMATDAVEFIRTHHAMSGMAERTAGMYRKLALARATFPITD